MVGEGGFGPPKSLTTDLQSAPFGRSGTPPYEVKSCGAGGRTRTPDLLITNQLLYQLSYTSVYCPCAAKFSVSDRKAFVKTLFEALRRAFRRVCEAEKGQAPFGGENRQSARQRAEKRRRYGRVLCDWRSLRSNTARRPRF